ncbi:MAG: hypothetical protein OD918_08325 [Gammaproteobacteria bacterium]
MLFMKKKLLWLLLASVMLTGASVSAHKHHGGDGEFKKIPLPLGGAMWVPAAWHAMTVGEYVRSISDEEESISAERIDALSKALQGVYGKLDADGNLSASIVIERLPGALLTQKDIRSASNKFMAEIDRAIKEQSVHILDESGIKIHSWSGHRRIYIDDWAVLRNSTQYFAAGVAVTENMLRVFSGKDSFLILLAFVGQQHPDMHSRIERMIDSIQLGHVVDASTENLVPDAKHAWFSSLSETQQRLYGSLYYIVVGLAGGLPAAFFRRVARRQFSRISSIMLGILFGIVAVILAEIILPYTLQHGPLVGFVLGISYFALRESNSFGDYRPKKTQGS